ncbi:MAG TPA: IS30 family transposase [Polyangia bacterium]|nr:IS30 family transposase [Polyangia bacterium]
MPQSARRVNFSAADRAELWRLWKDGKSISDIARALRREPGTIHSFLSAAGGIAPVPRVRRDRALSLTEREEISRGVSAGNSVRGIAARLGRPPSTVSRELRRNGGTSAYRAIQADARASARAQRPKVCKLARDPKLRAAVAAKLELDWSPEQVAGWLKVAFPGKEAMHVSHETIYRTLFIQSRGALKRELVGHLRSRRMMRRGRTATRAGQARGQIIDAVSIRDRPPEVEDRAVPGHWEGDMISGASNTHIATLVERTSRLTLLVKLPGKDASTVARAVARKIRHLPTELRRTLTWDRGPEMAQHKAFSVATDVRVYFCDPQSPWQRGTNENTNRLLRQYFPKGSLLDGYSQADLNSVARRLNNRPRKTLHFRTPASVFAQALP